MDRGLRFLARAMVVCVALCSASTADGPLAAPDPLWRAAGCPVGWPAGPHGEFDAVSPSAGAPGPITLEPWLSQRPSPAAATPGRVERPAGQQAQAGQSTQAVKPPAAAAAKPVAAQAAGARLAAMVFVTDPTGRPWEGVKVNAVGAVTREATSDRDGVARLNALRAGTYRVRFESPEVVTFEREIAVKAGPTAEFEVTLNAAPPAVPTSAPRGTPAPAVPPVPAPGPQAPVAWFAPTAASLPDWIERHYIGRTDPSAEGLVGEAAGATASVLQIRDPLPDRVRPDADQFFYVIAGDGTARVGDRQENITAGWLVVVPRGTSVSFERRGRNPLILLAVVAPRS